MDGTTISQTIPESTYIKFVQVTNFYYDPEETNHLENEQEKDITETEQSAEERVNPTDDPTDEISQDISGENEIDKIDTENGSVNDSVKSMNSEDTVSDDTLETSIQNVRCENIIDTKEVVEIKDKISFPNEDLKSENPTEMHNVDNKETLSKKEKKKEKRGKKLKKSKSFVNQFRQCLPIGQH